MSRSGLHTPTPYTSTHTPFSQHDKDKSGTSKAGCVCRQIQTGHKNDRGSNCWSPLWLPLPSCFLHGMLFSRADAAGLLCAWLQAYPTFHLPFKTVLCRTTGKCYPSEERLEAWQEVPLCRTPRLVSGLGPHCLSSIVNKCAI